MLTEDYLVRMIRDMGRMLARVLGSGALDQEAEQGEEPAVASPLLEELLALCGRGEMGRAEDLLFEELDFADPGSLPVALAFYRHLAGLPEAALEAGGFSREEVFQGLRDCGARYGVDPRLLDAFCP